jgi:hypothetical protein
MMSPTTNDNNYNQYIKTAVNIDYGINNDLFSDHAFIAIIIFNYWFMALVTLFHF